MSTFEPIDALVLMAIRAEHGAEPEALDLESIRSYLDFLDHAMYTDDEITGAIDRLVSGGHIVSTDDEVIRTALVPPTRALRVDQERKILEALLADSP